MNDTIEYGTTLGNEINHLKLLGALIIIIYVAFKLFPTTPKSVEKKNPLSIVVVGAGLIGPRHAEHVTQNQYCDLFGVIDINPATEKLCDALNTKYFASIDDMIEFCNDHQIPYPKGAIICTPNHTHIKVASQLAKHGIHLLIEKPVSPHPEDSKALKIFALKFKVKILVGHHRRFNPMILLTKQKLSKLGRFIAVQGCWTLKKHDSYFQESPWRTSHRLGGGPLLINLIHDLDLLQYLFGPISQVYAELLPRQRSYDNVDEGAVLTLKFKNGGCGTFICSDNVPSPFNFESSTGENPTVPFHKQIAGLYRVFGSNGVLSIPDFNFYSGKTWLQSIKVDKLFKLEKIFDIKPFDLQLNHFVDVINNHSVPNCDIDDGILALLVIKAVQKSIESGMPEVVSDLSTVQPNFKALEI